MLYLQTHDVLPRSISAPSAVPLLIALRTESAYLKYFKLAGKGELVGDFGAEAAEAIE